MNNRYANIVIVFVLLAFVVGLATYDRLALMIAPLKIAAEKENVDYSGCKENPMANEYRQLEKDYDVDLSFADCVFYKPGKGDISTFSIFDLPLNSMDLVFFGDSSIAWGLSTAATSQVAGLEIANFTYEGMWLNKANIAIYEAIASCVLKPEGKVVLSFTPTNQSQPGGQLTNPVMKGYRDDLRAMLNVIEKGDFCAEYFAQRKQGVIREKINRGLTIIDAEGVDYIHRVPEGVPLTNFQIGDRVSFRPAPVNNRTLAVSVEVVGHGGDFGLQGGILKAYDPEKGHGRIEVADGSLYFIHRKGIIQPGIENHIEKEVSFYAYQFRQNAMAYKVFLPGQENFSVQKSFSERLEEFYKKSISFHAWQEQLDSGREFLREEWGMDLPNIDFYGSRLEKYINPEWHKVKNQFDPESQSKIQWGDGTITIYGSTFSETAPDKKVDNFYQNVNLDNAFSINAEAVLDWASRREIVYMLPLSVVPESLPPLARKVYMDFYQDKLGLIDMHSHFIDNNLSPILMQFGHHPANEGGMVQSLEIGKVLREFHKAWLSGEKSPVNTEYQLYKPN